MLLSSLRHKTTMSTASMLPTLSPMAKSNIFTRNLFLPSSPLPSPRETHLWYVKPNEVNDDSLMNHYVELLSPCEKRNILQMNKDKVQKSAILARALVRTTIARYTNGESSPNTLKFVKNPFGKPKVMWENGNCTLQSLQFNISHTPSLIACGVTIEAQIGIDVEEKQRRMRNNILSLACRFFSPTEIEYLHSFSGSERQMQEFIKLWTLKEAYVKALGRGFSEAPFREFSIQYQRSESKQFHNFGYASRIVVNVSSASEGLTSNWAFALFELESSHFAALCIESNKDVGVSECKPLKLKVWKTIPLVEDEYVSGEAVVDIAGLS